MATFFKGDSTGLFNVNADWNSISGKPEGIDDNIGSMNTVRKEAKKRLLSASATLGAIKKFINEVILSPLMVCIVKVGVKSGTNVFTGHSILKTGSKWSVDYGDGTVVNLTSDDTSIPSHTYEKAGEYEIRIKGASIVSLGDSCFRNCTGLYSITIPSSIVSIGDQCFYGCSSLGGIAIPSHVVEIGNEAFAGCSSIVTIEIPSTVETIGEGCFEDCSSLTSISLLRDAVYPFNDMLDISIKDQLTIYVPFEFIESYKESEGWEDFNFRPIQRLDISVEKGTEVFSGSNEVDATSEWNVSWGDGTIDLIDASQTHLPSHTYSKSGTYQILISRAQLIRIGDSCFSGNDGITSFRIAGGVTSLGSSAFSNCTNLKSIEIPSTVESVGDGCFSGCKVLNVTMHGKTGRTSESVAGDLWGSNALVKMDSVDAWSNYNVTSPGLRVEVASGCTSIGASAFEGCSHMTSITVANSVTVYGDRAFYGCTSISSIPLSNGLKVIGGECFGNCESLVSILIPDSVESIGGRCFYACTSLSSMFVSAGNSVFDSRNNCNGIVRKEDSTLVFGCKSTVIPTSVIGIGEECFYGMTTRGNISFHNNLIRIGRAAFHDCTGITLVRIPASLVDIEKDTFNGCVNLSSVTFLANKKYEYRDGFMLDVPKGENGCTIFVLDTFKDSYIADSNWNGWMIESAPSSSAIKLTVASGTTVFTGASSVSVQDDWVVQWGDGTISSCLKSNNSMPSHTYANAGTYEIRTIGAKLFGLGDECFKGYGSSITAVDITSNITSIGNDCFKDCSGVSFEIYGTTGRTDLTTTPSDMFGSDATVRLHNGTNYLLNYVSSSNLSVEVDGTVETVGEFCIANCTGLTSVHLNNGVKKLSNSAFRGCTALKEIEIPESVATIEQSCFYNCTDLAVDLKGSTGRTSGMQGADLFGVRATVTLHNCPNYALYEVRSSDMKVEFADSVKSIGNYAFYGCEGMSEVAIGNGIETIGESAFQGCKRISSIEFTDSVTAIGQSAFKGCFGLNGSTIEIGDSIESVGKDAFSGCDSLTLNVYGDTGYGVSAPSSNDLVGSNATVNLYTENDSVFRNVTSSNMTAVVKDGVSELGNGVFYGCIGLDSITLPDNLGTIGSDTFNGCYGLSKVDIPETVTRIGERCFAGCTGLADNTVVIPNSVGILGDDCFTGCSGLHITLDGSTGRDLDSNTSTDLFGDNATIATADASAGLFQNITSSTMIVSINSGVTKVGDSCFKGCTGLVTVTIPETVTEFGNSSFEGCSSLSDVSISDSITSIGSNCFKNCIGMNGSEISIPDSVQRIGDDCFGGCSNLTIDINGTTGRTSASSADNDMFGSNATVKLHSVPDYILFHVTSNNLNVEVDEEVTSFGVMAFASCVHLTYINLPESLESIGSRCFSKCLEMDEFVIPSSVETIGDGCFAECENITIEMHGATGRSSESEATDMFGNNATVYLFRDDDTTVPDYLFYKVTSNGLVVIVDTLIEDIGNHTFNGCSGMDEVVLSDGLKTIGEACFKDCVKLSYITIPATVTTISKDGLSGDIGLKKVYLYSQTKYSYPEGFMYNVPDMEGGSVMSCRIYVPYELVDEYKDDSGSDIWWKWAILPAGDNMTVVVDNDTQVFSGSSVVDPYEDWSVDWGDGTPVQQFTMNDNTMPTHTYAEAGEYSIYVNGASIKVLGDRSFSDSVGLVGITIPPLVTTIGKYCFKGCTSLTDVSFSGELVTRIDDYAFDGCSSLDSVHISDNMTYLGTGAFRNMGSLVSVSLPSGITSVPACCFEGCSSLTSLELNGNITSLGESSFKGCLRLPGFTVPETVHVLPASCFEGCSAFTEFDIPSNITSIGSACFKGCSGVSEFSVPNLVTVLTDSCFEGCTSLSSFEIGSNISSIGARCFYGCTGLTGKAITIPSSVRSIGDECFNGCFNMSITMNGMTGRTASSNPSILFGSGSTIVISAAYDFMMYNVITEDISFMFSGDVVQIGTSCFEGCTGLRKIDIPASVSTIKPRGFYGCSNLSEIYLRRQEAYENYPANFLTGVHKKDEELPCTIFVVEDMVSYYSGHAQWGQWVIRVIPNDFIVCVDDGTIVCNGTSNVLTYGNWTVDWGDGNTEEVPSFVAQMPSHAYSRAGRYEIKISNAAVQSFSSGCFSGVSGIRSVSLPNTVTSLGDGCFKDSINLIELEIPDSVTSIGTECCKGCTSLESVTVSKKVKDLPSSFFSGCSSLRRFNREFGTFSSLGDYAFYGCENLGQVSFAFSYDSNSLVRIGAHCFDGCSSMFVGSGMGNVILKNQPTTSTCVIGDYAFNGCTNMRFIELDTYVRVGEHSFDGCSNLVSFGINFEKILSFGDYAFKGCTGLEEISVSKVVKSDNSLATYVFDGCTNIRKVKCGTGAGSSRVLGDKVFNGCTGIEFEITGGGWNCNNEDVFCDSAKVIAGAINITDVSSTRLDITVSSGILSNIPGVITLRIYGLNLSDNDLKGTQAEPKSEIGNARFVKCDNIKDVYVRDIILRTHFLIRTAFDSFSYTSGSEFRKLSGIVGNWFNGSSCHIENVYVENNGIYSSGSAFSYFRNRYSNLIWELQLQDYKKYPFKVLGTSRNQINPSFTKFHVGQNVFETVSNDREQWISSSPEEMFQQKCPIPAYGLGLYSVVQSDIDESCIFTIETFGRATIFGSSSKNYVTASGNWTINWGDGTSYSGTATNLAIPSKTYDSDGTYNVSLEGATLSSFESGSFSSEGIKSVEFLKSITSLKSNCFENCTGLESFELPETLTSIGANCFKGCTGLSNKTITIPKSVTTIGNDAFNGISGLSVNLLGTTGRTSTSTDSNVFGTNASLVIGSLYDYEFWRVKGLASVTMQNGIVSIPSNSFRLCTDLEHVVIPLTVSSIEDDAFVSNNGLEIELYGSTGHTNLSNASNVFGSDATIKVHNPTKYLLANVTSQNLTVELPAGTKFAPDYAFYGCSSLSSVVIPDGIKWLGDFCFRNCTGLNTKTIDIPSSVESIGTGCFSGCSRIYFDLNGKTGRHYLSLNPEPDEAFGSYPSVLVHSADDDSLSRISAPGGMDIELNRTVDSFGKSFARGNTGITSLTIPNFVDDIDSYAFADCTNLKSVTTEYDLSSSGDGCFKGCDGVTYDLYGSLGRTNTSAESDFFGSNAKVTIHHISDFQFKNITSDNLDVVVTDESDSLGQQAFYKCTGMTRLEFKKNDKYEYSSNLLTGVDKDKLIIYALFDMVKLYLQDESWNTFKFMSDPVTMIIEEKTYGMHLFDGSYATVETIPNLNWYVNGTEYQPSKTNLSGIVSRGGTYTITNARVRSLSNGFLVKEKTSGQYLGFKRIVLPDGLKTIGGGAFVNYYSDVDGCDMLELPDSVEEITGTIIAGYTTLKRIPSSLKYIPSDFIGGETSGSTHATIQDATIPASVKSIKKYGFFKCAFGGNKITIPSTVDQLFSCAFGNHNVNNSIIDISDGVEIVPDADRGSKRNLLYSGNSTYYGSIHNITYVLRSRTYYSDLEFVGYLTQTISVNVYVPDNLLETYRAGPVYTEHATVTFHPISELEG